VELLKSQEKILYRLKTRGPQSVKILSNQLRMTTMGIRQHLAELEQTNLVTRTKEEKQTRGRPVHHWKLTQQGHQQFPDSHSQISLELINTIRSNLGETALNNLIEARSNQVFEEYREAIDQSNDELGAKISILARSRSDEGYMSEVRLLPDGWLLVENHCPICAAAEACQQFCRSELTLFQQLLENKASVERVDHLLTGARRCSYKITPTSKASI
jgi:predicted ArsR family transcriptional regulator